MARVEVRLPEGSVRSSDGRPARGEGETSAGTGRARRNGQVSPRRLLGAFYTPDDLATVLTRWALAAGPGTVLDPSYGGCAFLRAAVRVLRDHHVKRAGELVYGVDIDPDCVKYAEGLVAPTNHVTANFLTLNPDSMCCCRPD